MGRSGPVICLVTARRRLWPRADTEREQLQALAAQIDAAIQADVDLIHIRERDLAAGVLTDLVRRAVDSARGRPARIIVNDRADVALAAGAAGVHLRADGPSTDRMRTLGPPGWIVGRSIHSVAEAEQHGSADYLLAGTVFPTKSKAPGSATLGLDGLRAVAGVSRVPVIAIGGIDPDTAAACIEAGASGIAAIGAFLPEAGDSESRAVSRAVETFRRALAPFDRS